MSRELESPCSRGGWVLALAPVAVGLALFMPLANPLTAEAGKEWIAPGHLGPVLALFLGSAGFWAFRHRFWPKGHHESRHLKNGAILLVVQALSLRAAAEFGQLAAAPTWDWWPLEAWVWMPWFMTSGLSVMLLGSRLGVLLGLSGVFLLYLRADPGPLPLVGCLVSSLFGVAFLRWATRRRVLRAGVGSGLILGLVGLGQGLQIRAPAGEIVATTLAPIAVGILSAFVVLALLPLLEWVLGELSDVTLAEYASHHPLLDALKEQAPGTWHHSLNVADLAEKAANAVGARGLLCKTAALYHDVGKLKEPGLYAENINGVSPHDDLDPRTSAAHIIGHVTHGLELARKHRLPVVFREIIAEHHGISVVRFFYTKACSQLREGEDAESIRAQFTYPGPPPRSRESGIIALADVVEAATRAIAPESELDAQSVVRKLIADRMAEGALAQCALTAADLARVEETFSVWVKARHHQRPQYPKAPALSKASEWTKREGAAQPA